MKLQDNLISKQAELINDNKESREKLNVIEAKFDNLKKKKNSSEQSNDCEKNFHDTFHE